METGRQNKKIEPVTQEARPNPSTTRWFITHVVVPLAPFFIGGLVLYIANPSFKINTLNCAELCLSMGIISIFIFQILLTHEDPLPNEDKKEEIKTSAQICSVISLIFVVLFSIIEGLNTFINERHLCQLKDSFETGQYIGFIFATFIGFYFILIQRSFKLKAKF